MNIPSGYRLTLMCDDCGLRDQAALVGRNGHQVKPYVLVALAKGWQAQHEGHTQLVVASPLDTPPSEAET